jgi:hypothetical protein
MAAETVPDTPGQRKQRFFLFGLRAPDGDIAAFGRSVLMEAMENQDRPARSNAHHVKRVRRHLSRPRVVMGLLLIIAIPIFLSLANKAVNENAEAIRQTFGR